MTTLPIFPGERLQRRILQILAADFAAIPAMQGIAYRNGREAEETAMPAIVVTAVESQEIPRRGGLYHVNTTIALVEDRKEANLPITGDTRPRHELRMECLSARVLGTWNGLSLRDAVNQISDGRGIHLFKFFNGLVNDATQDDTVITTEVGFTAIVATTQQ